MINSLTAWQIVSPTTKFIIYTIQNYKYLGAEKTLLMNIYSQQKKTGGRRKNDKPFNCFATF